MSRPLLEAQIRARVRRIPSVTIFDASAAVSLVAAPDRGRIIGVRTLRPTDPGGELTLDADLVVDATGRGSRTPTWLARLGLPQPQREQLEVGVRYASRTFRLRDGALGHDRSDHRRGHAHSPARGALQAIEGGRHLCSLAADRGPLNPPS
ncbi:MAG: hypothetical protein M3024_12945 [Candidatus Dormibacteraeota bacterium]|nr:hypothetical protein [Candidatus Dormibacteraeota bacterium]